jgi:hypothetical protein
MKPQYQHVNFEKGRLLVCLPAKLSLLSIARILVELYKRSHVRRQIFSSPLQRKSWFVELVFHVVGAGSLALAKLTPELNLVRASLNNITSKRKHKQEWGKQTHQSSEQRQFISIIFVQPIFSSRWASSSSSDKHISYTASSLRSSNKKENPPAQMQNADVDGA